MSKFLIDFAFVSVLIIGLTAFLGIISNGFGELVFGGKNKNKYIDQTAKTQKGWRKVGGNKSS
ncbi:MAG TPA: hypothetical protein VNM69_16705 [Bacillus sp. (in: firmicutes)]|uniref:hypothetical protein n=1 Tax=Bacillus litorisediminis TaxID=2922713 RepID=UPI001FAE1048|nr:hypothetical protein [Bacillus litorisediminis]HWO77507.1 hypothetical protein [Bacillus sp. (in: firmicutes)]